MTPSPNHVEVPGGGVMRVVRSGIVVLIALCLAWLAVREAIHSALEREYPLLGIAVAPASPVSSALVALNRAAAQGGRADDQARSYLSASLHGAPLGADPLIVAGLDASSRGQLRKAQSIFEEAERRDPRAVIPRYWLLDAYLRTENYAGALDEAQPLIRLQPAVKTGTIAVLTALVNVPAAQKALITKLREGPSWRAEFFEQLGETPRLSRRGVELLGILGSSVKADSAEREAIVGGLVAQGRFDEAREVWLGSLPQQYRTRARGIYDGDFAGWPGSPPFNWKLTGLASGLLQRQTLSPGSRYALAINSDGARRRDLAAQMVPIGAGTYVLRYEVLGPSEQFDSDTGLFATVQCARREGRALAFEVVRHAPAQMIGHTLKFAVPAGCPMVTVTFGVSPGIEPGPLSLFLTGISLDRS